MGNEGSRRLLLWYWLEVYVAQITNTYCCFLRLTKSLCVITRHACVFVWGCVRDRETAVFYFFLQLSSLHIIHFTSLGDRKKIERKQREWAEKMEYMMCWEKDRERTRDNEEQPGYRSWKERQKYLISFSCQFLILNNLLKQPAVSAINTSAHCRHWESVCVCVCGAHTDFAS